jgi:hypothetical protein
VVWNCLIPQCGYRLDTYDAIMRHMEDHHDISSAQFSSSEWKGFAAQSTHTPFRWTKISRTLVNPAALSQANESFEANHDYVLVHRVLTEEEIHKLAALTLQSRCKMSSEALLNWNEACRTKKVSAFQRMLRAEGHSSTATQLEPLQAPIDLYSTNKGFSEDPEDGRMSLGSSSTGTPTQAIRDPFTPRETGTWSQVADDGLHEDAEADVEIALGIEQTQNITQGRGDEAQETTNQDLEAQRDLEHLFKIQSQQLMFLQGTEASTEINPRIEAPPANERSAEASPLIPPLEFQSGSQLSRIASFVGPGDADHRLRFQHVPPSVSASLKSTYNSPAKSTIDTFRGHKSASESGKG